MAEVNDQIGWKKGIYPTDEFLQTSLQQGKLFSLREKGKLLGCVILNSAYNEGYQGLPWSMELSDEEVLVPHALSIRPDRQNEGLGKRMMQYILQLAKERHKKAIRLDILGTNQSAERLYRSVGFQFVAAKTMYYLDTGWTEYKMFELVVGD